MRIHSGRRLTVVGAIAGAIAFGAIAGPALAATGDGSGTEVRKAPGERSTSVMVDPGGGGESIIAVL